MAFTGCISGALLNLLLGLGLTLLFAHRNNSNAGIDFKAVDNEGRATLLIILASICTLLVLLSLIASENWSVRKWHAKIIFGLYFFTVGSAFIIYLWVRKNNRYTLLWVCAQKKLQMRKSVESVNSPRSRVFYHHGTRTLTLDAATQV